MNFQKLATLFIFFFTFTFFAQNKNVLNHFAEIKKDTLGKEYHFYISKYAVSVQDYKNYLNFLGLKLPEPPDNYVVWNQHSPMVAISYDDFMGYVNWLTDVFKVQFRAPTDLEWTIAAANQENPMQKLYASQPVEVDFIRPNKYGISGMNGNVWEWTSTLKDNEYNIIRGGSYMESMHPDTLNVSKSSAIHASLKLTDVGFRLAIDATEMQKYLFAQKVETILKQLFPEYTNLGVDAESLYVNDGFIHWSSKQEIIEINFKENFLRFLHIDYLDDQKNAKFSTSEKFYFSKEDIQSVEKLKKLINTRHQ